MSESVEINLDAFWSLIDQAKEHQGDADEWLKGQLIAQGEERAIVFDVISGVYRGLAHQYGIWCAASVIDESCTTNSGFDSFKTWLVGQGREVYMAALKDPDSLADAPDYRDRQFCSLALAGRGAYDGDSRSFGSYEHVVLEEEVRRSIVYGDGIGYPYDWPDIPAYLPRLYAKYYTDEQRRRCTSAAVRINTWNPDNPAIKAARKVARKGKKGKGREQR